MTRNLALQKELRTSVKLRAGKQAFLKLDQRIALITNEQKVSRAFSNWEIQP